MRRTALASVAMLALAVLLTAAFSSPDVPRVTIAQWASADRYDFLTTAVSELEGTSESGRSGGRDLVLAPLAQTAPDAKLTAALRRYGRAPLQSRLAWLKEYTAGLDYARGEVFGSTRLPPGAYGPVPVLLSHLLTLARTGALDAAPASDPTKPLLFLGDGEWLERLAQQQHLLSGQWGMMNETGNYPGQPWLWLPAYLYQVSPFATSHSVDAEVWGIMALLSLALVLVPWLPGVRSLPRWLPVYRLIWRDYYRVTEARDASRGSRPAARPSGSR